MLKLNKITKRSRLEIVFWTGNISGLWPKLKEWSRQRLFPCFQHCFLELGHFIPSYHLCLCKAAFLHTGLFSFTGLGSHSSFSLIQSSCGALSVNSSRLITATSNRTESSYSKRTAAIYTSGFVSYCVWSLEARNILRKAKLNESNQYFLRNLKVLCKI